MATQSLSRRVTSDAPLRPPAWASRFFLFLPVPVVMAALILLHLGGLPTWQEALGQAAVVLIGFSLWALWARAQEADQNL